MYFSNFVYVLKIIENKRIKIIENIKIYITLQLDVNYNVLKTLW